MGQIADFSESRYTWSSSEETRVMAEIALETRGLTRKYGERFAVRDLDLQVRTGDIYGFLGPNGAGKTTAMRAILGLIRRDAGSVKFFDQSDELAGRCHVGAIIEVPAFHEWLSGRENLQLSALYAGLAGAAANAEIDRVLERVGLTERAKDRSGAYSLGMKQRLGIARALLGKPRLLLLDEPTNGLDPKGMREMRELVRSLAMHDGLTVFISSHLLSEVQAICNRVGILAGGTLRAEGKVEELLADTATAILEVGSTETERLRAVASAIPGVTVLGAGTAGRVRLSYGETPIPTISKALFEAGLPIDALVPIQRNLEDVFLELTR
jgi:ABC-2 type transport system ATP-binding protein